jgi:hypothetical protein
MPSKEEAIAQIFEAMSLVFTREYRERYKTIFEDTAALIQGLPGEATEEIRNAFDHFATACESASGISTDDSSTGIAEKLEVALTNIERGRRHVTNATLSCIKYHVMFRYKTIIENLKRLELRPDTSAPEFRRRFEELEKRLGDTGDAPVDRRQTREQLAADIKQIEELAITLGLLANDYDLLDEDVRDAL